MHWVQFLGAFWGGRGRDDKGEGKCALGRDFMAYKARKMLAFSDKQEPSLWHYYKLADKPAFGGLL